MPRKSKSGKDGYNRGDLWIAPSHSLKWPPPKIGWELRRGEPLESNKFLELADFALGLKQPEKHKKKRTA